jgi:glucokinase
MDTILAGDVGGTNTRLAMFDPARLEVPLFTQVYHSGDYESLQAILERFVEEARRDLRGREATRAGFGIAGPVDGNIARVTNLPWRVDGAQLAARLGGVPVQLVNDFAAIGYAVPRLHPRHVHQIGGGTAVAQEPIGVVGAGTGLGECMLFWNGTRYQVVSSEGGHTDFAPHSPLEMRLLEFLMAKYGPVSWERVLSGPGLVNIYEFLREQERMEEPPGLTKALHEGDPAAVISHCGMEREHAICERALDLFVTAFGAKAGNLCLIALAKGGIYLAGGIAAKVLPRLEEGGFRHAFENKGRFQAFLQTVPVFVILHPQPGLLGAAIAGLEA